MLSIHFLRRDLLLHTVQDLGYHSSRHADEFGAYVLTEPASFWRGRLSPEEVRKVQATFPAAAPPFTVEPLGGGAMSSCKAASS